MATTTIKVDTTVRDRLAAVARGRGVTLGALLDDLATDAERSARWAEVHEAYARLQADEKEWASYLAESEQWSAGGAIWRDHHAAREEWPEYQS